MRSVSYRAGLLAGVVWTSLVMLTPADAFSLVDGI